MEGESAERREIRNFVARDTMRFTTGASSGLTQCRRFMGVTLGELGEPDPQAGDDMDEFGERGEPSKSNKPMARQLVESNYISK